MKKLICLLLISSIAMSVCAAPHRPKHPHRPPAPPPRHHIPHHHPKPLPPKHHHNGKGAAIAAGVIGGALVGAAIAESLKPDPVVVTTTPVVTPAPVVVTTTPVVTPAPVVVQQPVTQIQRVWVEGRYIHRRDSRGVMRRVWEPGHYEERTIVVSP